MQWVTFLEAAEYVKQRLDALATIGKFVQLKKRGRNYLGLCPFHNERSPSFNVSAERGVFKCFGCGESGDAISFLMKIEHKTYGDVIREQAETHGLQIKASHQADKQAYQKQLDEKQKLLQLMQQANQFYQSHLASPAGNNAKTYLEKQRGYALQQLAPFELGASPDSWDALTTYLLSALPFLQQEPHWLETAGLASPRQNGGGYYDKFRDRLLFPIHNPKGEVVAFGGRAFSADVQPKYLNSPETPLYHKSATLYGVFQGKESIRTRKRAIVMEGYFDVLATHLAGFPEAVATCGTALTEDHLKLLLKSGVEQLYLCFDSDKAGQNAALAGIAKIEPLLERHPLKVKVIQLPNGKDPDDFFKTENATTVFEHLLANAPDYLTFQLTCAIQGFDLRRREDQLEAAYKILPLLAKINNPMRKAHLLAQYADILNTPEEALRQSLQQFEKRLPKLGRFEQPTHSTQPQGAKQGWQQGGLMEKTTSNISSNNSVKPKGKQGKYLTATERLAQQAALEDHSQYRQRLQSQQNLTTLEQTALAQLMATNVGFTALKPLLSSLEQQWDYPPFRVLWPLIAVAPSVSIIRPQLPEVLHPLWDGLLFEAERWYELLGFTEPNTNALGETDTVEKVRLALSQTIQRWQERKTQDTLVGRNKQLKQILQTVDTTATATADSVALAQAHEVDALELQCAIVDTHPAV